MHTNAVRSDAVCSDRESSCTTRPRRREETAVADTLVAHVAGSGYRRLGLQGQSVVLAHAQLTRVLRDRLGRDHARLLARPEIDPRSGDIDWYAPGAGKVVRASALGDAERLSLTAKADRLRADILALSAQLLGEGDAASLVARMLEAAMHTPAGDWLYAADGEPLLVMWGHASDAAVVAEPPRGAPPAEPVAPAAVAAGAGAGAAAAAVASRSRARWAWLLLLPLLLLLLFPLYGPPACVPLPILAMLPDRVVDEGERPRTVVDPIAEAQARRRALEAEIAFLQRQRELASAACVPVQRRDYAGDVSDTRGPLDRSRAGPLADADRGPGRDRTAPPQDDTPPPDRDADTVGTTDPPPADDKPLEIPPDQDAGKPPDFLKGRWRVNGPMNEARNGRNVGQVDVGFEFDEQGRGEMLVRRRNDGSICRGPATGAMDGERLRIRSLANLTCDRGPALPGQRIECSRGPDGRTLCRGVNPDGRTYNMEITRGEGAPEEGAGATARK